jgi:hypothetical protein
LASILFLGAPQYQVSLYSFMVPILTALLEKYFTEEQQDGDMVSE